MGHQSLYKETDHFKTLQTVKKVLQALCLGSMIAGFATSGALGYQGWKLFHNPYRSAVRQAQAPTPEAAAWAAEVYRLEKRDHLFYTGLFVTGLAALCVGSWFGYRHSEKRLQELHRAKQTELQKPKTSDETASSVQA